MIIYIHICTHHRLRLHKVFLSQLEVISGKSIYGVCFLLCGGIEPKCGFYSPSRLKLHPLQRHRLFQRWGICYCLGLQLQGQPVPQTSWNRVGSEPGIVIFFFFFPPALKGLLFHPHFLYLFAESGDPWGEPQTTTKHAGDHNHSLLPSKLKWEKNAQVKH